MYEVFEQLLQKHSITPYKVAKEAGVTQTALSNWKSGRSTPTTKTLQKIADYFGVTIDYLMNGATGNTEHKLNTIFSKRLLYYLNKYEMTQLDLAIKLGVDTDSVSDWYNGIKLPQTANMDAICNLFHCSRSDLMEEKIENSNPDPDIRRIQRARAHMGQKDRDKMMKILEASFEDYFGDNYIDNDSD